MKLETYGWRGVYLTLSDTMTVRVTSSPLLLNLMQISLPHSLLILWPKQGKCNIAPTYPRHVAEEEAKRER
jgi:hypothetical protein